MDLSHTRTCVSYSLDQVYGSLDTAYQRLQRILELLARGCGQKREYAVTRILDVALHYADVRECVDVCIERNTVESGTQRLELSLWQPVRLTNRIAI